MSASRVLGVARTAHSLLGRGSQAGSLVSPITICGVRQRQQRRLITSRPVSPAPAVPGREKRAGQSLVHRSYSTSSETRPLEAPSFAFAFDIDGVLLHVAQPIPGATESLRYLQEHNIPFILLTNGGGKHEKERVADLSSRLNVQLTTANFIQSHTPFQELARDGPDSLRDKTILVTGANPDKCRTIAETYGFRSVVTPADILHAHPDIWPFEPLFDTVHNVPNRPLPQPIRRVSTAEGLTRDNALKIDAVFVFSDPRDWGLDTQLITDLLLSEKGFLGTYSPRNGDASLPNCGWQGDGQPPIYFSNSDLFWSTGYHQPRFGQGAFQAAVAGVWRRVTGGHELERRLMGKPFGETYRFAERVLTRYRHELLREGGAHAEGAAAAPLRSVYMVGDNPESDIAGANGYSSEVGTQWSSALVRTGVWSPERAGGEDQLKGEFKPTVIVDDVREAVRWALRRERWQGKF